MFAFIIGGEDGIDKIKLGQISARAIFYGEKII